MVEMQKDYRGQIDNVVFDFGNVLIWWNPHRLYDKFFDGDVQKTDYFLSNILTSDWVRRLDRGEPADVCTRELVEEHPEWKDAIEAFHGRWLEMHADGEVEGMAEFIDRLKEGGYNVFGLSNWSADTFEVALTKFPILGKIPDRVVSGYIGMTKPDAAIYEHLFEQFGIDPHRSIFIDDSLRNVQKARELGMYAIQFTSYEDLMKDELISDMLLNGRR